MKKCFSKLPKIINKKFFRSKACFFRSLNQNKKEFTIDVEEGKTYFFCQCGESSEIPLCDASHESIEYENENLRKTALEYNPRKSGEINCERCGDSIVINPRNSGSFKSYIISLILASLIVLFLYFNFPVLIGKKRSEKKIEKH